MRTALTERLGIDAPVIQGSLEPWSSVRLASAVCEAGGLGTLGTAIRHPEQIRADIEAMRARTDRPFAGPSSRRTSSLRPARARTQALARRR